ncbi:MAG: SCO family protein [Candidatus Thiodiazotropha sp.]|nr:SCO family protein [Candidatus Thiodiazotropha sp.]MCM8884155.1 SCO family protein [Candidatus Thiodiazotropha sp.]MCM8919764.1 SCO family protein [Candidatus Thiodiazotropha sp.]MCU7873645.1 SCO family protein [Candidatus Thiodiazotropha sp. (ex Lucinoma borealis)]MCU7885825.1 SCO family protein [Candidatus Thiodiazotropha sp. (ex Lucinoma annulata)]
MQRFLLFTAIALMACLLIWLLVIWQPAEDVGNEANNERLIAQPKGGDFTLLSHRGAVSLSDFRGKVVLLYFGYTWCPDICPTNLAMMSAAMTEMGSDSLAEVQPIFVSVDPERDTPQRLKDYVEYFHPSLVGVTGSAVDIEDITKRYGAAYRAVEKETETQYTVDHTADTYIIDRHGKLAGKMPHGSTVEELIAVIRPLLQENLSR